MTIPTMLQSWGPQRLALEVIIHGMPKRDESQSLFSIVCSV